MTFLDFGLAQTISHHRRAEKPLGQLPQTTLCRFIQLPRVELKAELFRIYSRLMCLGFLLTFRLGVRRSHHFLNVVSLKLQLSAKCTARWINFAMFVEFLKNVERHSLTNLHTNLF